jgi:aminopeptidase YwaD
VNKAALAFIVLSCSTSAFAQKWKKEDKQTLAYLQQHVEYLASDKLEGRRTGTAGEAAAAKYIEEQFAAIGLQAKGANGFLQAFEVAEGRQIQPATFLTIDGKALQLNREFFPLAASSNGSMEALPSVALQEPKMPWFVDVKEVLDANAGNPHFDLPAALAAKAKDMKAKGATALFLYNSGSKTDGLKFDGRDRSEGWGLPVVYLTSEAVKTYLQDASATLDVKLRVDVAEKKRNGNNVVGYLDNGAPLTIVFGAHFDHLGYGEDGNSREAEKKAQIHNGADDNASGTAALIELARRLKASKQKTHNYLFIAFSGEELGLYGSKYFTEHPTIDLNTVSYMINMDMIGRLNDSSKVVTVGGYGTSAKWGALYGVQGKKGLYNEGLQFRFDSSGTGPSDHTSFYRKNIPVLFFFTGLHSDYHKPTDDFDKINYNGQMRLVRHILSLVEATDKEPLKLAFTKTREAQTTTSARFTVSMGIMPDYTFSGNGVRVDGVSENRPAQKAGIAAGDVITKLGDYPVSSVEGYMQALSKFKKGDRTAVEYNRAGKALSATVEF